MLLQARLIYLLLLLQIKVSFALENPSWPSLIFAIEAGVFLGNFTMPHNVGMCLALHKND
jgi:hypothetical protein